MFSMAGFLRLLLLSISAFFSTVLSLLRLNRQRSSAPVVDIELGGTPVPVMTPGRDGSDTTRSIATPESDSSPHNASTETSKHYSVLVIESSEPANPTSEHSDSHASTESSSKGTDTEERSLESAATSVAPTLADGTEESKSAVDKDEELLVLSREAASDDSSHTPNSLSASSSSIESRNIQALPELSTEDIVASVFPVTVSYDESSSDDDDDDLEVPSHRCLKLAIDDMWCHQVLHPIKEVDEENTEEEIDIDAPGASPTIVIQSPSFGNSLSRAQSATNRLAAILKLLEGELAESRNSIYMDSIGSISKLEVDTRTNSDDIGYDCYSKIVDKYYIPPSKMCNGEESWKLLSDDPFKKSL